MKQSDFRSWLNAMWLEHVDEVLYLDNKRPDYNEREYFRSLRWWLKREYKLTRGKN